MTDDEAALLIAAYAEAQMAGALHEAVLRLAQRKGLLDRADMDTVMADAAKAFQRASLPGDVRSGVAQQFAKRLGVMRERLFPN